MSRSPHTASLVRSRVARLLLVPLLLLVALPLVSMLTPARAQSTGETTRVSVASDGSQGNGGSTNPSISGDGSYVAFSSSADNLVSGDTNDEREIFVHNRETGETTRVSVASDGLQGNNDSPTTSVSGGRIVFTSGDGEDAEIYVMDTDGSNLTQITNNSSYDGSPSWSPDGLRIAFTSYRDGNVEIYVMDTDGSNVIRLTDNSIVDRDPNWSPDGSRIVFTSGGGLFTDQITLMDADGSNRMVIAEATNGHYDNPTWSPDGNYIAFDLFLIRSSDIYIVNVDGSNRTNLIDDFRIESANPAWSPDGSRIAFESDYRSGGATEIYLVDTDGVNLTRLTYNSEYDSSPAWSPDGSRIVFHSDRNNDGNDEIYVMNVDGSNETLLTDNVADNREPDWQPVATSEPEPDPTEPPDSPEPTEPGQPVPPVTLCPDDPSPNNPCRFPVGPATLVIKNGTFESDGGLSIEEATLELPAELGGTSAAFIVKDTHITSEGVLELGDANAVLNFPNIQVGGDDGFGIQGAKATLSVEQGTYLFSGAGTFVLPGVGSSDPACKVGTRFTLASAPPPLRQVSLSLEGDCVTIPIGNTGFFINKIAGTVTLDVGDFVAIDIALGIQGGPDVPVVGAAVSGEPAAHWDNSWKVGLSGDVNIFSYDLAEAALELSQARGLEGEITIRQLLFEGTSSLHVWKDRSDFHIAGKSQVAVQIEKGMIAEECIPGLCVSLPPETYQGPRADADFGEFRTSGGNIYGIKGSLDVYGYHPAFFIDVQGNVTVEPGGLDEYQLVEMISLQQTSDVRQIAVEPDTEALLVGLAFSSGAPTLSLTAPDGEVFDITSSDVIAETTADQIVLSVPDPAPGDWVITIGGLQGDEDYTIASWGAAPPASITEPAVTDNGDGSYTIDMIANSPTPTSTITLFYDTSAISRTGIALAEDLPLDTTTYRWEPENVVADTYYIYAMVDDPLGAPAYVYSDIPITIQDDTPPDAPENVQVRVAGTGSTTVTITWNAVRATDLSGYRLSYTEPDSGQTVVTDIPNREQTSYIQQGLYLSGNWAISVSAYDINGNESPRSDVGVASITLGSEPESDGNRVYLPLIRR